jgi:hypothetical protein
VKSALINIGGRLECWVAPETIEAIVERDRGTRVHTTSGTHYDTDLTPSQVIKACDSVLRPQPDGYAL